MYLFLNGNYVYNSCCMVSGKMKKKSKIRNRTWAKIFTPWCGFSNLLILQPFKPAIPSPFFLLTGCLILKWIKKLDMRHPVLTHPPPCYLALLRNDTVFHVLITYFRFFRFENMYAEKKSDSWWKVAMILASMTYVLLLSACPRWYIWIYQGQLRANSLKVI